MHHSTIPVIDLLAGKVVRGIAGRRSEYRIIESPWSACGDALEIVRGIQLDWGLKEFYVADLDAILHDRPQWKILEQMVASGARLMVDCGVRDPQRPQAAIEAGIDRVIIALETLDDLNLPKRLVDDLGPNRLIFSLDLMHGRPMTRGAWESSTTLEIVARIVEARFTSLIVLDLAGVGVGAGIPTLPLCREIRQAWPSVNLITGGGVRDETDIAAAIESGATSVLVASALHDGRLKRPEAMMGNT